MIDQVDEGNGRMVVVLESTLTGSELIIISHLRWLRMLNYYSVGRVMTRYSRLGSHTKCETGVFGIGSTHRL